MSANTVKSRLQAKKNHGCQQKQNKKPNKLLLTGVSETEKLNQPQKSFLDDLLKLVCLSLLQHLHFSPALCQITDGITAPPSGSRFYHTINTIPPLWMKCALSIKFCLFGVTLVKMFALPKINRETPQSPTSRLLHCQFIADLLLVVGQMLEGLLVQTCFSQHLVLVEQQLAVLVVHFVRRRLNRPEKEQTTLSVSNILYQARMTENLQEPLCFSGNSELFSVCVHGHTSSLYYTDGTKTGSRLVLSGARQSESEWALLLLWPMQRRQKKHPPAAKLQSAHCKSASQTPTASRIRVSLLLIKAWSSAWCL